MSRDEKEVYNFVVKGVSWNVGDENVLKFLSEEAGCRFFLIDDVILRRFENDERICLLRFHDHEDFERAKKLNGSVFFGKKFEIETIDESMKEFIPSNWFEERTTVGGNDELEVIQISKRIDEYISFLNKYDVSTYVVESENVAKKEEKDEEFFNHKYPIPTHSNPVVNWMETSIMGEKRSDEFVRFCIFSDTHEQHNLLSFEGVEADVAIHCGDFTENKSIWKHEIASSSLLNITPPKEVVDFNNFMSKELGHIKHRIVIAGNHDLGYIDSSEFSYPPELRTKFLSNCVFLNNSSFEVKPNAQSRKRVKIYCVAFNTKGEDRKQVLSKRIEEIPDDTNILIFHFPPIFGQNMDLFVKTQQMKDLKVVCFGHFHYRHFVSHRIGNVVYISAPSFNSMNGRINPTICFNYYL